MLVIAGASTRAAAFSAIRAGLSPVCFDLFADLDLRESCPVRPIPLAAYPQALEHLIIGSPPAPWMYTGAIENAPGLVEAIAARRPLWGNGAEVLRLVRDPFRLHQILLEHGFVSPKVAARRDELPRDAAFLVKPFDSGGGEGIELLHESWRPTARGCYFQERIAGVSCSAIFVGIEGGCRFLGGTRQLTGRASSDFAYAGSIGPYPFDDATVETLRRMGEVLQREFGLRGLFGVDFLLNEAGVWPVELNPRYTASVEVLELALGCSFLGEHARAFGATKHTEKLALPSWSYAGKRVLFASRPLVFPEVSKTLFSSFDPIGFRELADIPSPGTEIGAGDPILTVFAHGATLMECDTRLHTILREWLQRLHQA